MTAGRTLVNFQPLPEREKMLDRDTIDADMRDALAKAEARLNSMAERYGVTGWSIDTNYGNNGYDYGIVNHTVVGRLRLVRPD
jgi:hypothetical protein